MMNKLTLSLAGLALISTQAFAECTSPDAPEIPDGATAAMEDMLAGQKSVKAFQEANLAYMKCLEEGYTAAEETVKNSTEEADVTAAQDAYTQGIDAYNDAVSKEEEVAGQFNVEIREYKAANPG
ncbi:MAG: hypothetical protein ABJK20_01820 [Halieaceae bacterium]